MNSDECDADDRETAIHNLMEALFPGKNAELEQIDELITASHDYQRVAALGEEEQSQFADRVRRVMRKKGVTQQNLAQRAGISQPAFSNSLTRGCRPQRRTIKRFADALGVTPEELWPDDTAADDAV